MLVMLVMLVMLPGDAGDAGDAGEGLRGLDRMVASVFSWAPCPILKNAGISNLWS